MGVDRLIASINAVHRVAIAAVLIAAGGRPGLRPGIGDRHGIDVT
jgi:hypothetical protein